MIKVKDIAYAHFSAPDLDAMEKFVSDFGFIVTSRSDEALHARGTDPEPYVHVTSRGEAGFRGVAFEAASTEDLRAAAQLEGASEVEKIEAPGGGERVRFIDPDGYEIDVVHGRELLPSLEAKRARPLNLGSQRPRIGELQRVPTGPAAVKRVGHAGFRVTDFRRSEDWYKSRFGFISSDEVYLGAEENVVAAFMRCDLGDAYTDHHTLVCIGAGEGNAGLDHVAFEVQDFDAVMAGHDHLETAGYQHKSGVGRHVLGSQVFDYWCDPWGNVVEHYTDGDLLDASFATGRHDPGVALGTQWGVMTP
jgi:catechol 2,3-dioxygenase-like lactoylglutathione lyase family enzyme